jgi:hypothetical protein
MPWSAQITRGIQGRSGARKGSGTFRHLPELLMDDMSLQVNLGAVDSVCSRLEFSFVVRNNGDAHLQVYASDTCDRRKSGVLLLLNEAEYRNLKALIEKTDQTIDKLRTAGQMRRMLVSY